MHAVFKNQRIAALVDVLLDQVQFSGLINDIGIVAGATDQGIQTAQSIKNVVAGVAGQHIVLTIAEGIDVGIAAEFEIFQVVAQRPADRCAYGIYFTSEGTGLTDDVGCIVDHIGVVASATDQGVDAGVTVENIVAGVACDYVIRCVAIAIDIGIGQQRQILHILAVVQQAETGRREYRVDLAGRVAGFNNIVVAAVDVVSVIAGTAIHRVVTCSAIEDVIQVIPAQYVVEVRANGIFDFGAIGNS